MDWQDTADFAEPSNMDREWLVEQVARRLDNFRGMRRDGISLEDDLYFIYLVFHRILSGKDYEYSERPGYKSDTSEQVGSVFSSVGIVEEGGVPASVVTTKDVFSVYQKERVS